MGAAGLQWWWGDSLVEGEGVAELNGDAVPAAQLVEEGVALLPAQPQGLLRRDQQLRMHQESEGKHVRLERAIACTCSLVFCLPV